MTDRLEINWKLDGFVSEQRYYCSETPINPESLPVPKAVLSGEIRTYVDTSVELGKTYYVRIGAVRGTTEKISDEVLINIAAQFDPITISSITLLLDDESDVVKDTLNRVSSWIDRKGGVEFTQTNTPYMPVASDTINSLSAIVFNNSYLVSLSAALREMWNAKECLWAFCVYKCTLDNTLDKSIFNIKTNNSSVGFSAEAGSPSFNNKPFAYSRINGYADWRGIGADNVSLNEWVFVFYEINFATNSAKISVNGTLKTALNLWTSNQGKTEALTSAGLGIGNTSANAAFKFNGSIAAILSGSATTSMSTEERQKLEGWAAHKFGLINRLPISHPYKTIAPIS